MKRKLLIGISLLCVLATVTIVVLCIKGSKSGEETSGQNQTGMQAGEEDDSPKTSWEDGLKVEAEDDEEEEVQKPEQSQKPEEKQKEQQEGQSNKEDNKEESIDTEISEENENNQEQEEEDNQEEKEEGEVPGPNTESGWGPIQ